MKKVKTGSDRQKQIIINTAYTMGGTLLMNGVLQVVIYPLLNRHMGSEALGVLLYIMGLVAIVCPSVGQSLNTSRLVVRRDYDVSNGDYNILLLIFGGICTVVSLAISTDSLDSPLSIILTIVLIMTTAFRYYGEVEYRLNLNYQQYFIYYCILTVGYVAGYGLYILTGCWFLIFFTGEVLVFIYVALTGSVYRRFLARSTYFKIAFQKGGFLFFSYLITNLTLNVDRLVLKHMLGDLAVTQYYVTSLIGKTLVLLVAPVNTIIISYLTKNNERMGRKKFMAFTGAGVCVSLVFMLGAQIVTPVFIRLLYSDLYESCRNIITIVNLAQILAILSAYLFIVVLTFTDEKWQLALQIMHLLVMAVLILLFGSKHGIMGFAVAVCIANGIRVLAVIVLGFLGAGRS